MLDATVNLATEQAKVRYLVDAVGPDQLKDAVRAVGYEAAELADGKDREDRERAARNRDLKILRRDITIASAMTLPIFVLEMGAHLVPALHHSFLDVLGGRQNLFYLLFALATVVQFGPGLRFYRKGWPALRRGAPDMNALVMLGTTAAYDYSVVATFLPGILPAGTAHVYYEASAVIVTLILIGRYLEGWPRAAPQRRSAGSWACRRRPRAWSAATRRWRSGSTRCCRATSSWFVRARKCRSTARSWRALPTSTSR
ncbi:MAG: hypothetical protein BroJett029_05220 [Alphaproteobacteria bacterium]|nr:MAG: hypothetical protein BroJett029_05220 [Alphaproteobacteria bacterium]